MKKTLSCIILLMQFTTIAKAQHYRGYRGFDNSYNSINEYGRHELRIGIGAFSTDQILGIENRLHTGFDFPKTITGADVLSYRYHLQKWMAIGLSGAIDYQRGNRTNYSKYSDNAIIGKYRRCAYTGALDFIFTAIDKDNFQLYGSFSFAETWSNETSSLDKDYYNKLPYHTGYAMQADSVWHSRSAHVNGQLTVLGIKSNGPAAFFLELGYGYKGIICMGISARL